MAKRSQSFADRFVQDTAAEKPLTLYDKVIMSIGATFLLYCIATPFINYATVATTVIEVERMDRTSNFSLVWTTTGEVFTVQGDLLQGKFAAAETYGKLEVGASYRVRKNWGRVTWLGQYPNILEAEKVTLVETK
jgi:hypothetical protein